MSKRYANDIDKMRRDVPTRLRERSCANVAENLRSRHPVQRARLSQNAFQQTTPLMAQFKCAGNSSVRCGWHARVVLAVETRRQSNDLRTGRRLFEELIDPRAFEIEDRQQHET